MAQGKQTTIKNCHKQNVRIITWTVNTQSRIEGLINKGMDGMITDFTDLLIHKNKTL